MHQALALTVALLAPGLLEPAGARVAPDTAPALARPAAPLRLAGGNGNGNGNVGSNNGNGNQTNGNGNFGSGNGRGNGRGNASRT